MKRMPQVIIFYWIFFLLFVNTDWYAKYSEIIDLIDTVIVGASLLHYFIFYKDYRKTSTICVYGISSVVFLHFVYYQYELNNQTYYIFYTLIIAATLYFCFKENRNSY